MPIQTSMDFYADTLLRNIGKVYILPQSRSTEYRFLHQQLTSLLIQTKSGEIDRQKAAENFNNILSKLKKSPPREGRAGERISVILDMLNPRGFSPKRILDVGAGTSDITLALKTHYNLPSTEVFAIDQKLPTVIDVTALTYVDGKIPLADCSIDLVIMFVVLHHIPPQYRDNIIAEIARVLSPDGVFIIREHDNDNTPEFYVFLDMIHIFWYLAFNETPDPLYLLSRTETQELMKQHGLESAAYNTYTVSNPQRLYHEMFIKKPVNAPYKFKDISAQSTIQAYLDKFRLSPRNYESFTNLVPLRLQQGIINNHQTVIQTNISSIWPDITKEIGLSIILHAVKCSPLVNGTYEISSDAINQAIVNLS